MQFDEGFYIFFKKLLRIITIQNKSGYSDLSSSLIFFIRDRNVVLLIPMASAIFSSDSPF